MSMVMSYKEFCSMIRKEHSKKVAKVRNSWGVRDAYKYIRKNKWFNIDRPLKEKEFYSIIRTVNNILAGWIAEGKTVTFPERMGSLELKKRERGVSIVGDKLKITYPVDWESTIQLWFKDEEARNNKTLLRFTNGNLYLVKYCKYNATYTNKSFYEFTLNRFIKRSLTENIKKGVTDTLW